LSLWLNAAGAPGEIAARAGNCVRALHPIYTHCIDGREDLVGQEIEDMLDPSYSIHQLPACPQPDGPASVAPPRQPVPAGHLAMA